ncbi:LuxR C-terminal-related transcriptional regulator [Winogradskyella schleiferi]|uniref:LuxR C-terminal-related transcriptional regulator n=1 Tax=Winogradskyella schleiferi TaxID=2686078 RepID=UPI0015BCB684|nr:LuxR C-terminal-related transcriptional regulator [Winogradskyella schleiferi]
MNEAIVSYKKIFNTDHQYDGKVVMEYIENLKKLDNHTPPLESFILVTNTSKHSYEYIGNDFEKTLGLDRDRMLNEGLNYYLSHYHPQDLPILLKVFEDLMIFTMNQLSIEQRQRVVYTWNYRIKNGNNKFKNMYVQQTPIFFDPSGQPIIGYSHNSVVGDNIPKPIIGTCKFLNADNKFETLFHKNYFFESLQQLLTKRELEVVKLLANSRTTKDIALQLFLSVQTVSVHRKNILKKLELKSTSEIIEYCNKYQVF